MLSCPTLCHPMDYSLPVSVHGIFQARILEWKFLLEFPSPRDLPYLGIEPCLLCFLHCQAGSLLLRHLGSPTTVWGSLIPVLQLKIQAFKIVMSETQKVKLFSLTWITSEWLTADYALLATTLLLVLKLWFFSLTLMPLFLLFTGWSSSSLSKCTLRFCSWLSCPLIDATFCSLFTHGFKKSMNWDCYKN